MAARKLFPLLAAALALASGVCRGAEPADAKKKAQRVTSYVNVVETMARVGIQVGWMLERNPYDRALSQYATELGALHVRAMGKLTPPEGAEALHRRFKKAVTEFALTAAAFRSGDYPGARKHGEACRRAFNLSILEVQKLRKKGVIPSIRP